MNPKGKTQTYREYLKSCIGQKGILSTRSIPEFQLIGDGLDELVAIQEDFAIFRTHKTVAGTIEENITVVPLSILLVKT